MSTQNLIRLGISFLIVTNLSSCNEKKKQNPQIAPSPLNVPVEFDRKEQLFMLLSDLNIEFESGFICYMPSTYCGNCVRKVNQCLDSLLLRSDKILLLHSEANRDVCNHYGNLKQFYCIEYNNEKIESKYGFYYWDPIVFEFKNGHLKSFEVL